MPDLPSAILNYINAITIENRSPAYLLVDKNGQLSDWGGALEAYGITNLQNGEQVAKQIFFLEGYLPLNGPPIFLSCIKTESGLAVDIHIFTGNEGDWVLLLDASSYESQRSLMQQKVNDLNLLRGRQSRILNRSLGENLVQEIIAIQEGGERRDVTILFANLRGFISYSEQNSPETVFKILDLYLRALIEPIISGAGLVDKIMGDAVMAIFGLLASTNSPAQQAVVAAFRMIEAIKDVNGAWQSENRVTFDIGIGAASGPVVVNLIAGKERGYLSAVGRPINLAAHLQSQTRSNEIIIDEISFEKIGDIQSRFSEREIYPTTRAFSIIVP